MELNPGQQTKMSGTISPRDRLQVWVNTFLLKQKENSGSVTATFRENQFQGGGGVGICIETSIRGGGVFELSDQLLDPDVPTLASQDKLKVSPKGLPFVIYNIYIF